MEKKEQTTPVGICEKLFNTLSIGPAFQTIRRIPHGPHNSTATVVPNPSPPPHPPNSRAEILTAQSKPATSEKPSPIKASQFPAAPGKVKVSEVAPSKVDPPPRPPPQKSAAPLLVAPKIEPTLPPVLVQEKEKLKPKVETAQPAKAVIGQGEQKVQDKEKRKAKVETAPSANAVFRQGQEKAEPTLMERRRRYASFVSVPNSAFLLFKRIGVASLRVQDYLGFELCTFAAVGAILSATDSVCTLQVLNQEETPLLYSLVFGEGVVNDATSIVLFNAVQTLDFNNIDALMALKLFGTFLYLFFTSTVLGIAMGLISAYVIKTLYLGRHSTDREVAIMMLMAYLSYMLAELLSLSGILTIFFCGIVMSHYTWHNVTESSQITTKHAFATISFIAETFIFLYVGMDALDVDKWKASKASAGTSIAVSSTLFALVLVGRAAFIFPLANIANWFGKRNNTKIELRQQFIIWWAGLMRGAVTIALSYNQFTESTATSSQDCALMITCTIIVVLFSTVVFGSITKPLIDTVLLRHSRPSNTDTSESQSLEDLRLLFLENGESSNDRPLPKRSSLSLLIRHPTSTVHHFWRRFDDRYMRPVFGGRGFVPFVPRSPTGAQDDTS
ncbi:hypothetical protein HHK36_012555 [Tetracentron sinense]|uniref:Cation/H+ exchanger transmembrane domain-containing protein n=1 Tax=Tetracentron sinense TaxID=13715 RepID=A0A834Z602_TETSI|nr:hypothetical protein HHK36_012555 [Tetracentron sinense]